jgi:hypothetical protein
MFGFLPKDFDLLLFGIDTTIDSLIGLFPTEDEEPINTLKRLSGLFNTHYDKNFVMLPSLHSIVRTLLTDCNDIFNAMLELETDGDSDRYSLSDLLYYHYLNILDWVEKNVLGNYKR